MQQLSRSRSGVAGCGSPRSPAWPGWSARDSRKPDGWIIEQRRDGFLCHVTGTLDHWTSDSLFCSSRIAPDQKLPTTSVHLISAVEPLDRVGRMQLGPMLRGNVI
jgi:hypothetical protein